MESAPRRALKENTRAASGAIERHLDDVSQFLVEKEFITDSIAQGIKSKSGVTATSQASEFLDAVKGKVDSRNDHERGSKWLEKFLRILVDPDIKILRRPM
jgi:hypothetical protein